jgi:thiamine biosynthesis protein ThiI
MKSVEIFAGADGLASGVSSVGAESAAFPYDGVLCRYSEIAIKKRNRIRFENILIENLYRLLRSVAELKISRVRGRVFIRRKDGARLAPPEIQEIRRQMPKAFGVESYSFVLLCEPEQPVIESTFQRILPVAFDARLRHSPEPVRFRIRAHRSDKRFPLHKRDLEIRLAELVGERYRDSLDRLRVDLSDATDVSLYCEVRREFAALYVETEPGPGGLPAGSNGKVLVLLSGGFDSPVASYLLMKRGCHVDYITFHSSPYTPPETLDKVERIAAILNSYQSPPGRLFRCNLIPLQKEIRDLCGERCRTVLYRRMMFRIAAEIAVRQGCLALATGESVGQVASQTLVNLATIDAASPLLVLRPLAGTDKQQSINLAKIAGLYDVSCEQVPDSCTVFAPRSPSTAVPEGIALAEEDRLPEWRSVLDGLVAETWELPLPEASR